VFKPGILGAQKSTFSQGEYKAKSALSSGLKKRGRWVNAREGRNGGKACCWFHLGKNKSLGGTEGEENFGGVLTLTIPGTKDGGGKGARRFFLGEGSRGPATRKTHGELLEPQEGQYATEAVL